MHSHRTPQHYLPISFISVLSFTKCLLTHIGNQSVRLPEINAKLLSVISFNTTLFVTLHTALPNGNVSVADKVDPTNHR